VLGRATATFFRGNFAGEISSSIQEQTAPAGRSMTNRSGRGGIVTIAARDRVRPAGLHGGHGRTRCVCDGSCMYPPEKRCDPQGEVTVSLDGDGKLPGDVEVALPVRVRSV